jgi:hypothetical protein
MAKYTIKVLNNSGFAKNYVLFMQPPAVTSTGGQPVVYSNAWVTFNGILPGGTDTVEYTDETFAYWATATMPIAPGTTMGQSGAAAVDVTLQDSVTFAGTTPIGFGTVTPGGAMTGSYRIIANNDFTASNGYLFGLARPGNVPSIPSPVATFIAEPNDTFNVTPDQLLRRRWRIHARSDHRLHRSLDQSRQRQLHGSRANQRCGHAEPRRLLLASVLLIDRLRRRSASWHAPNPDPDLHHVRRDRCRRPRAAAPRNHPLQFTC